MQMELIFTQSPTKSPSTSPMEVSTIFVVNDWCYSCLHYHISAHLNANEIDIHKSPTKSPSSLSTSSPTTSPTEVSVIFVLNDWCYTWLVYQYSDRGNLYSHRARQKIRLPRQQKWVSHLFWMVDAILALLSLHQCSPEWKWNWYSYRAHQKARLLHLRKWVSHLL